MKPAMPSPDKTPTRAAASYLCPCELRSGRQFASVSVPARRLCATAGNPGGAITMGLSFLLLIVFLAFASPALCADFLEENGFFRVVIAGHSYRLEALTVKPAGAAERNRAFVEGFLAAPFEKALARVSQDNYMYGGWGFKTIGDARKGALDGCGKQRPPDRCAIVMENNSRVGNSK
jgi:hypothetical protein